MSGLWAARGGATSAAAQDWLGPKADAARLMAADDGEASAISRKSKKKKRKAESETLGEAAGDSSSEAPVLQDDGTKGGAKRPKVDDAPVSSPQEPPRPPRQTHPALAVIREVRAADRSLTAKKVHALLPERGFAPSLAMVKKLCSAAFQSL